MALKYNGYSTEREYTRKYESTRGVDFSDLPRDKSAGRFGYLENMYVDYDGGSLAIESIPGFRKLASLGQKINGIFSQKLGDGSEYVIVHSGTSLYRFNSAMRDSLTMSSIQTLKVSMENRKSRAVVFGEYLFILDGVSIIVINRDGFASALGDGYDPYIPDMSITGALTDGEDINLLSSQCVESYNVTSFEDFAHSSPGLTFAPLEDEYGKCCEVTGINASFSGPLYIPSYTVIDGSKYKVTRIGASAFRDNTGITELHTNMNLTSIGKYSFWGCTALRMVFLSNSVKTIEHHAFYGCSALSSIYVGEGFEKFEVNAFQHCTALKIVMYAGEESTTSDIAGKDYLNGAAPSYGTKRGNYMMSLPMSSKISQINSLKLDGYNVPYFVDLENRRIIISISNPSIAANTMITIVATVSTEGNDGNYYSHPASSAIPGHTAIKGCTLCAVYDGRIFISGNPELPGFVFYCSVDKSGNVNPFYFGANNYFVDGVGKYEVSSLLSSSDHLTVFKSGDDGSGSIFYHSRSEKDGSVSYPVTYVYNGAAVKDCSFNFLDDEVFLTDMGLCALERTSGNALPKLRCRSSNINPHIFTNGLDDASITEWRGYLVLSSGGRVYLADSRQTFNSGDSFEYEWYYLNGIGTRSGAKRVYRYSSSPSKKFTRHPNPNTPVNSTVYSITSGGTTLLYTDENGYTYAVYSTDEMQGGVFSPATCFLGMGELLYFGTESGNICVFNNDKRGVPPDRIKNSSDFDPEEYRRAMGDRIHPDFYDFASIAPRYLISTGLDDCDVPDMRKNSVKGSLVIKHKSYPHSVMQVEVATDTAAQKTVFKGAAQDFGFYDIDFRGLAMQSANHSSFAVPESERNWMEKSVTISSTDFRSPIGIYSIIYRYKIKGKLKTK